MRQNSLKPWALATLASIAASLVGCTAHGGVGAATADIAMRTTMTVMALGYAGTSLRTEVRGDEGIVCGRAGDVLATVDFDGGKVVGVSLAQPGAFNQPADYHELSALEKALALNEARGFLSKDFELRLNKDSSRYTFMLLGVEGVVGHYVNITMAIDGSVLRISGGR